MILSRVLKGHCTVSVLASVLILGLLSSIPGAYAQALNIPPGFDSFQTVSGSPLDFSVNPIPADFFCPGSPPFSGIVPVEGNVLAPFFPFDDFDVPNIMLQDPSFTQNANEVHFPGFADTVVERLAPANFPNVGDSDTIPIEIVALSLRSVSPISVPVCPDPLWDVLVDLSGPSTGSMNLLRTGTSEGTLSGGLSGNFQINFISIAALPTILSIPLSVPLSLDPVTEWFIFSPESVGGTALPIDTTALLVAGAQTMTPWLILGVVAAVGIGLAVFTIKRSR